MLGGTVSGSGERKILQGDNFRISQSCLAPMNAGDTYNARIRINYVIDAGGLKNNHTDTGTLRGPAE